MLETNKNRSFFQASTSKIIFFIKIMSSTLIFGLLYFFFIKSSNTLVIPATLILAIISFLIILFTIIILLKESSLKKNITISTLIFIVISFILYTFTNEIFSLFIHETGLLNFTVYEFKILFFAFPLLGFKISIEKNFYNSLTHPTSKACGCGTTESCCLHNKNVTKLNIFHIIYLIKGFLILLLIIPTLYNVFSLSGILWGIPISIIISTSIDIIAYFRNLAD